MILELICPELRLLNTAPKQKTIKMMNKNGASLEWDSTPETEPVDWGSTKGYRNAAMPTRLAAARIVALRIFLVITCPLKEVYF